ncbi:tail fiber protein [Aquimarina spongiae]|uniref:Uncharacterized protein n=1 Tax=Aquimarina spongiae TaxID=570521 RepID=A0A1M6LB04_9FLAO|nr:tail fiber protein [Aquimarina spongiae]SHJ68352.1 hypothetical protein SAMN04488508_1155 [Aquimarina spongiae]
MKRALYLAIFLTSILIHGQTEIKKTVVVDGPGWKRVARLDGAYGRGYNEITIHTEGGATSPRVSKISWMKGWSAYGGLNISSVSDADHWSDARITYDDTKAYLEINFKVAIAGLKVYLNQSAWTGGDIFDGTLPNGGGSVLLSAQFGRLNYGENDLLLLHNGNLGLGAPNPAARLDILSTSGQTESLTRYRIADAPNDYLQIANSTGSPNQFIPVIKGHHQSDNRYSIQFMGTTSEGNDVGGNAVVNFDARRTNGPISNRPLFLWTSYTTKMMTMTANGNLGIGTTTPDSKLTVKGKIHTQEVKVDLAGAVAPDYVFLEDYNLKTLEEVSLHIQEKGHLPNIPSAKQMEKEGVNLKEMNLKLLEKIEELTLYTIEQDKKLKEQKIINEHLLNSNNELEKRLIKLEQLIIKK